MENIDKLIYDGKCLDEKEAEIREMFEVFEDE
jgi:hypothetical protein